MSISTYDKGDKVRCSGVFTNAAGTAIDPDVVRFSIMNPAGTTTTYLYGTDASLVRDSAGHYHVDVDTDTVGDFFWRMYSTGVGKAAAEGQFKVTPSLF